jgi:hypothetical protein
MSRHFYRDLPPTTDLLECLESSVCQTVPEDWLILLTDVRGSTRAIAEGRYRQINLMGASSIVAVLNIAGDVELPYIFGGDGATLLIPPELRVAATVALQATQALAQQAFNLDLRIGVIPVADIALTQPLRVAKFCASPYYEQAIFSGGGLTAAEVLLKQQESRYAIAPNPLAKGDFQGLECRWHDIPSPHGEVVTLLAVACERGPEAEQQIYHDLLQKITTIYGSGGSFSPIRQHDLRVTLQWHALAGESRVRGGDGWWSRWRYQALLWLSSAIFRYYLLPFNRCSQSGHPWSRYLALVEETADYRKYDDTLRMIIASSAAQRAELEAYLATQQQAGKLVYGLHLSDRATLTCLVFERMGRQVHFVDGADGGYALAATGLKQQLAGRQARG